MTWGSWGKVLDKSGMIALIQHCFELGVSTFDHADIYGGYTTEQAFGEAFADSEVKREDIQLISKCGIQYLTENRNNKLKHYDYSRDYIIWSAETSLKHLQTDYLDLFLLHRPSPLMHPQEVMEAIAKLGQEGKIRDFGVSNFTPSQVDLITSQVPVQVNQIEFSATHLDPIHDGTMDQMMLKNIIPMAWSPLGSVFRESNERSKRIIKQLELLSEKYQASEDQLLLSWIMKHPAGVHPVIGTTNPDRIKNAVKAIDIELELQDWFSILVASQGQKVP